VSWTTVLPVITGLLIALGAVVATAKVILNASNAPIEKRMDGLDKRVEGLDSRIDRLDGRMREGFSHVRGDISRATERMDSLVSSRAKGGRK